MLFRFVIFLLQFIDFLLHLPHALLHGLDGGLKFVELGAASGRVCSKRGEKHETNKKQYPAFLNHKKYSVPEMAALWEAETLVAVGLHEFFGHGVRSTRSPHIGPWSYSIALEKVSHGPSGGRRARRIER